MRICLLAVLVACGSPEGELPVEPPAPASGQAAPDSPSDGLVGSRAVDWQVGAWANGAPRRLTDHLGRVLVVRFWTDTCPFCEASLPALQKLADELAGRPVDFVGLYHSKPLGSERPWAGAVARARELGVRFPIAYDHNWATVKRWWLDHRDRAATSATFVIGADGRIVHIHPGPVFFPSDRPDQARPNREFLQLRAAILAALPAGS